MCQLVKKRRIWRQTARKVVGGGLLTETQSLSSVMKPALINFSCFPQSQFRSDRPGPQGLDGKVGVLTGRHGNDRAEELWQRIWVIWPKAQRMPFGLHGTVEEHERVSHVFRNLSYTDDFKSCGRVQILVPRGQSAALDCHCKKHFSIFFLTFHLGSS